MTKTVERNPMHKRKYAIIKIMFLLFCLLVHIGSFQTISPKVVEKGFHFFLKFSPFSTIHPDKNFSFIAITSQILCSFKVLGIFVNFVIFDFLLISEACQLKILLVLLRMTDGRVNTESTKAITYQNQPILVRLDY